MGILNISIDFLPILPLDLYSDPLWDFGWIRIRIKQMRICNADGDTRCTADRCSVSRCGRMLAETAEQPLPAISSSPPSPLALSPAGSSISLEDISPTAAGSFSSLSTNSSWASTQRGSATAGSSRTWAGDSAPTLRRLIPSYCHHVYIVTSTSWILDEFADGIFHARFTFELVSLVGRDYNTAIFVLLTHQWDRALLYIHITGR